MSYTTCQADIEKDILPFFKARGLDFSNSVDEFLVSTIKQDMHVWLIDYQTIMISGNGIAFIAEYIPSIDCFFSKQFFREEIKGLYQGVDDILARIENLKVRAPNAKGEGEN